MAILFFIVMSAVCGTRRLRPLPPAHRGIQPCMYFHVHMSIISFHMLEEIAEKRLWFGHAF